jgi:hypothetical protein
VLPAQRVGRRRQRQGHLVLEPVFDRNRLFRVLDRLVRVEVRGAFTLDGQPGRGARLGFASLTEEEIATASRRLTAAISHVPTRRAQEDLPRSPRRS